MESLFPSDNILFKGKLNLKENLMTSLVSENSVRLVGTHVRILAKRMALF